MTIKRKDHDLSTTTHRNSADPNAYLTVPEYVDAIRELHRAAYLIGKLAAANSSSRRW